MSDSKAQHEPSMEEILASIRRIIAEDTETAAPAEAAAPAVQDEVLELTEVVADEPPAFEESPHYADQPLEIEEATPTRPAFADETRAPAFSGETDGESLISREAAAQSRAALSQLSQLNARSAGANIPLGNGSRTIESMVLDLLRPMLKDWLDANLPSLVERLVQEEIRRVVREGDDR